MKILLFLSSNIIFSSLIFILTLCSLKSVFGTENFEASEVDDYSEYDDYSEEDDGDSEEYNDFSEEVSDHYIVPILSQNSDFDLHNLNSVNYVDSEEEDDSEGDDDFFIVPDLSHFSDFDSSTLDAFEIAPLLWKSNLEIVSSTSYEIGIPSSLMNRMRDYSNSRGITQLFRNLMSDPMDANTEKNFKMLCPTCANPNLWHVTRPAQMRSNSHWLEPGDEETEKDYQNMLLQDDFYRMLDSIGTYLGLDGIYVNNITFMAVSYCDTGTYPHVDFSNSDKKAFNLIFHLEEAKNANPELIVFPEYGNPRKGGSYKYNENRGIFLGDTATHATAPCDYRETGEMRVSATVYFFDANEDNVDGIMEDFDQYYPSEVDRDYILKRSGIHWREPNHDEI